MRTKKTGKKWFAAAYRRIGVLLAVCVLLLTAAGCAKTENTAQDSPASAETENTAQDSSAGAETGNTTQDSSADARYADIVIEDYGAITIALDGEAAPETVKNFIALAESGFYDGLTFHRIIEGFMMQGGAPKGDGAGGAKTIIGEFSSNGHDNPLSHTRGTVSMARAQDYNSATSQFFIVQEDSTYLDGEYAAFGSVTAGMDVVDQICADARPLDDNGMIAPDEQPVIVSITIR